MFLRTGLEFLESLCHINNTAEAYEMSLLFYLWYMQQGLGIDSLWAIEGGAQEYRIKGGCQQLSVKLSKKLQGNNPFIPPPCYCGRQLTTRPLCRQGFPGGRRHEDHVQRVRSSGPDSQWMHTQRILRHRCRASAHSGDAKFLKLAQFCSQF